jgi:hypothetical protein
MNSTGLATSNADPHVGAIRATVGPARRAATRVMAAVSALAAIIAILFGVTAVPASASTYSLSNVYLSPA